MRPATPQREPGATPGSAVGRDRGATRAQRVEVRPEFGLPRSTEDLSAGWRAAEAAERAAATDSQRAAVRLRMESLTEPQRRAPGAGAG